MRNTNLNFQQATSLHPSWTIWKENFCSHYVLPGRRFIYVSKNSGNRGTINKFEKTRVKVTLNNVLISNLSNSSTPVFSKRRSAATRRGRWAWEPQYTCIICKETQNEEVSWTYVHENISNNIKSYHYRRIHDLLHNYPQDQHHQVWVYQILHQLLTKDCLQKVTQSFHEFHLVGP